ncbi:unnamed protein product [Cuscuta campestris]|uniref:Uncharacterized protein n=1 Tax=Cuscuta campestris TaxID=132261 RepID=A0A484KMY9_9ASTE|nr:unnamed protein product [Cuscuta campestris]
MSTLSPFASLKKSVVVAIDMADYPHDPKSVNGVNFYALDDKQIEVLDTKPHSPTDYFFGYWFKLNPRMRLDPIGHLEHRHASAGACSGSRIYCAGGFDKACVASLGPLVVLKGTLFAIGGVNSTVCSPTFSNFIEYYEEGNSCWIQVETPPGCVNLYEFVCGVWEEHNLIVFGSADCASLVVLRVQYGDDDDEAGCCRIFQFQWFQSVVRFDVESHGQCIGSEPAIVSKGRMMWLDTRDGTTLVVLNCYTGEYFCHDLAEQGVLPSPKRDYHTVLVALEDEQIGLVWRDPNSYVVGETKDPSAILELIQVFPGPADMFEVVKSQGICQLSWKTVRAKILNLGLIQAPIIKSSQVVRVDS